MRVRNDLPLLHADLELAGDYASTLKRTGLLESSRPEDRVMRIPCLLDCLLVKAAVIPSPRELLELEPIDIARRRGDAVYIDPVIVDTIVHAVVSTMMGARTRRQVRKCLSDKLRHLRSLREELYDQKCREMVAKFCKF
jgi:hypothetical protein